MLLDPEEQLGVGVVVAARISVPARLSRLAKLLLITASESEKKHIRVGVGGGVVAVAWRSVPSWLRLLLLHQNKTHETMLRLPAWSAIRAHVMTPMTLQFVTNLAASLAAIQPAKPTMSCVPRLPLTANLGLKLAGRLI